MSDVQKLKDVVEELSKAKRRAADELSKTVTETRQARQNAEAESRR